MTDTDTDTEIPLSQQILRYLRGDSRTWYAKDVLISTVRKPEFPGQWGRDDYTAQEVSSALASLLSRGDVTLKVGPSAMFRALPKPSGFYAWTDAPYWEGLWDVLSSAEVTPLQVRQEEVRHLSATKEGAYEALLEYRKAELSLIGEGEFLIPARGFEDEMLDLSTEDTERFKAVAKLSWAEMAPKLKLIAENEPHNMTEVLYYVDDYLSTREEGVDQKLVRDVLLLTRAWCASQHTWVQLNYHLDTPLQTPYS